mmetsp:Transcript_74152/g.239805  ORF Transcript_74152/g.239805 Transcript_74152/m.239805 type:complete len:256 (-) Transcript_74152:612-1379(-)
MRLEPPSRCTAACSTGSANSNAGPCGGCVGDQAAEGPSLRRTSAASLRSRIPSPHSCVIRSCSAIIWLSRSPSCIGGRGPLCFHVVRSMSPAPRVVIARGGAAWQFVQISCWCSAQCHLAPFLRPPWQAEHKYSLCLTLCVHSIMQPPVGQRPASGGGVCADARASFSPWAASMPLPKASSPESTAREATGPISSTAPDGVATNLEAPNSAACAACAMTCKSCWPFSEVCAVFTLHCMHISKSHCWQPKTASPGL